MKTLFLFLACIFGVPALADDVVSPLPGGTSLFPQDATSSFHAWENPPLGICKLVDVTGPTFKTAVELQSLKRAPNPWDFQATQPIPGAIHRGDVLWVTLWIRATEASSESQEGFSELSIEQGSSPYEKLAIFELSAGREWKQYAWAFAADHDLGPGKGAFCLRGGYAPQVIQIGGIQMLDYGANARVADLPRVQLRYPGMEPDAPWRKAAAERIERFRKGDLKIEVKDSAGHPISGATVTIRQQRHVFGFGSCVIASLIEGTGPDNDRYREIIKNNFSKVVMENDLKWGMWQAHAGEQHHTALAAMQWLQDQGLSIRGHNLVWPSWQYLPEDMPAMKNDKVALEKRVEDHLRDEAGLTKGRLTEWDVVNEPFANHDLIDILGPDIMGTWFRIVHETDPAPVLFLNDYAGLTSRGEDTEHKQAFEKTLRTLKEQGVPIGGLGIQAHMGGDLTGPEQIVKELDRWAALGLEVQITEFDVTPLDEEIQGRYTRDFMTAVFSHPAVSALLTWGFWENADWLPSAAMYRKDWSIKPNGQAWNELVLKEWHTDVTLPTDANGIVTTRGFLGTYEVTVIANGVKKSWPLTLPSSGATLTAVLGP